MEKYIILLGYFDKQAPIIKSLYDEIIEVDNSVYANRYVFAMKTQELYTALEDLFKQIAKSFENHIKNLAEFHKELLIRMNTEMPKMRPAVLSRTSMLFLNEVLSFRHFVRHAYGCPLDEKKLRELQTRLREEFALVDQDLRKFRKFILSLAEA